MAKPVLLTILDGLGLGAEGPNNAFALAETPNIDRLMEKGFARLTASGQEVGLPSGQMGNSEVGHLNIGAGRIVDQELNRISKTVKEGRLKDNPVIMECFQGAKEGGSLHLMGLLSDGGVHSHRDHLYGLLALAKEMGIQEVYVHGITDGRDVAPRAAKEEVEKLEAYMEALGTGKLVSIIGRYYAMDRDKRWDRTQFAYDLFYYGAGIPMTSPIQAMEEAYALGQNDEFLKPYVRIQEGRPVGRIQNGDHLVFFNFRPDRARQIVRAMADPDFSGFQRYGDRKIYLATMTEYDETIPNTHVVFQKENIEKSLGQVVSERGLRQLRIAETEKYPHVTFFFNGGREEAFEGEDRILVNSPKVATYDLEPQMSAYEVTERLLEVLDKGQTDMIILNFANPDMVGHTGILSAAIEAVETVDRCLGQILAKLDQVGGCALITSDHGNCEVMAEEDGTPKTSHTSNQVPLMSYNIDRKLRDGILADLAPSILELMGIEQPKEMTGKSLLI